MTARKTLSNEEWNYAKNFRRGLEVTYGKRFWRHMTTLKGKLSEKEFCENILNVASSAATRGKDDGSVSIGCMIAAAIYANSTIFISLPVRQVLAFGGVREALSKQGHNPPLEELCACLVGRKSRLDLERLRTGWRFDLNSKAASIQKRRIEELEHLVVTMINELIDQCVAEYVEEFVHRRAKRMLADDCRVASEKWSSVVDECLEALSIANFQWVSDDETFR